MVTHPVLFSGTIKFIFVTHSVLSVYGIFFMDRMEGPIEYHIDFLGLFVGFINKKNYVTL